MNKKTRKMARGWQSDDIHNGGNVVFNDERMDILAAIELREGDWYKQEDELSGITITGGKGVSASSGNGGAVTLKTILAYKPIGVICCMCGKYRTIWSDNHLEVTNHLNKWVYNGDDLSYCPECRGEKHE